MHTVGERERVRKEVRKRERQKDLKKYIHRKGQIGEDGGRYRQRDRKS